MSERNEASPGPEDILKTGNDDIAADKARAMLGNPRLADAFVHLRTGLANGEEPFQKKLEPEELRPAEPSERADYAVAVLKPLHQQTLKMQTVCIDPAADPRRMVTQPSIATRGGEPTQATTTTAATQAVAAPATEATRAGASHAAAPATTSATPTSAPDRPSAPDRAPRPARPLTSPPRARTGVASAPWSRRRVGAVACGLLLLGVAAAAAALRAPRPQEPVPEDEKPSARVPATSSPQRGADPAVTRAPVLPSTAAPAPSSTEINDPLTLPAGSTSKNRPPAEATPAVVPPVRSESKLQVPSAGRPTSTSSEPAPPASAPEDGPPPPVITAEPARPSSPPALPAPNVPPTSSTNTKKSPRILGSEE